MRIAVAFLCYNDSSSRYLEDFLPSLEASCRASQEEISIYSGDNSDPGKEENRLYIERYNLQAEIPVIYDRFENNLGFAKGFNKLIDRAISEGCEAFLMLNPDMLIEPGMVSELASKLTSEDGLACVFPLLYRWDYVSKKRTDEIDTCGIGLKPGLRFFDIGQGKGAVPQGLVAIGPSGAAAMFRLSALRAIRDSYGYFDERFFMYKEDCDLAYRLYRGGMRSLLVPQAQAFHDRSAAKKGGILNTFFDWKNRSKQTRTWSFVNQHLIFAKHWKTEPLKSRLIVFISILFYGIFSLILAQFLLKSYPRIIRSFRHLD